MNQVARLVHLLGLVLFLGSILAFAVTSGVPAPGDLAGLVGARHVISVGTAFLTLPGLALLIGSGLALMATTSGMLRLRWVRVMVIAAGVVVGSTVLLVVPAVRSSTALAEASLRTGSLAAGYRHAYMTESVAGGVNIALTLVAMAAGVWGFGTKQRRAG